MEEIATRDARRTPLTHNFLIFVVQIFFFYSESSKKHRGRPAVFIHSYVHQSYQRDLLYLYYFNNHDRIKELAQLIKHLIMIVVGH